jgi:hypothetical protein
MLLELGGVRVRVTTPELLSDTEQRQLVALEIDPTSATDGAHADGTLACVPELPCPTPAMAAADGPAPATVHAHAGGLLVHHRSFSAWIDPRSGRAALTQSAPDGVGLLVTLRVLAAALLPARGGLPLHAAGIVLDGYGLACFGVSGAGKSTLAATWPGGVLSDEQVALLAAPPRLAGSGFWGSFEGLRASPVPLRALIELAKGPTFECTRLAPALALRRLLGVLLVPPQGDLWSRALTNLASLVRQVPAYRMAWSPSSHPWNELRRVLASAPAELQHVD